MARNGQDGEGKTTRTKGLRVSADPQVAQGKYANLAMFRHTQREFVFDFLLNLQGEAQLVSRVLTSPQHAKEVLQALKSNIDHYENQFGKISK